MKRRYKAGLGVLALGTGLVGFGWWALNSEPATNWLLRQLPGLEIEQARGSVLGDFSAQRVVYRFGVKGSVTLTDLRWQGLQIFRSGIKLGSLKAEGVDVVLDPSKEPSKPPASLRMPLNLEVSALDIKRLAVAGQTLTGLRGSLRLAEAEHRVQLDAVQWQQLRLSGRASVQSSGSMAVDAALALAPSEGRTADSRIPDWRGTLALTGPLAELQARAEAQAAGQSLRAEASLQTFAPWPLAAFTLRAEKLDISALLNDAPRTALTGEAQLKSKGWAEPAELQVELSNAAAGRWDQQRLPVEKLKLALQGRADQPDSLRLSALDAQLIGGGRVTGQGELKPGQAWALTAKLSGIRPALLDARLAPMQLGGTAQLAGAQGQPLTLKTQLSGDWQKLPLRLAAQASLQGKQLEVPQALLESGRSRLSLSGKAELASPWRAEAQLEAQGLDPRLLWAGEPGSAWQKSAGTGTHVLNARGQLKLQQGKTWPQGPAQLELLAGSQLSGVAITGKLDYLGQAEAQLSSELRLAGANRLLAVSKASDGLAAVQTQGELQAPRLAALNPLLALVQPTLRLEGAAEGKFGVHASQQKKEPWQFASDGALTLRSFRVNADTKADANALSLAEARLRWAAGSRLDAPLVLVASAERLAWTQAKTERRLDRLSLDLQGSWAQHRMTLAAQGPPGEMKLSLSGGLSASPLRANAGPIDWQARIAEVMLRTADTSQPTLLSAAGLDVLLQLRGDYSLAGARLAPGRAEVAGARLRWSEPLLWQGQTLSAALELEPLPVAPLLARWQPDFGWGGQLVVGGRARLRASPQLDAEIVLERAGGDLSVTDERGVVQQLGLTDLRLGLTVREGLWQFTQALAGTNMGSLGGAVTVHARREALWPEKDARLDGVLQANVAKVGTWGAWLPPGWRLGGTLAASLQMAGTAGAPLLRGQAEGKELSVRNPLFGVDVTDGSFAMSLDGETARLQRFSVSGAGSGKGTLTAEGEARLGEQPSARLTLKAERFTALSRVDRRVTASGQAQLALTAQAVQLDGSLRVDEGLFDFSQGNAPSLGDDVQVLRTNEPAAPAGAIPVAKPAAARQIRVKLALDLGEDLKLRGHGLDTRLRGELQLTHRTDESGKGGPPALTGTVRAVGGSYQAYGQKLEVERSEVIFSGPYDNPRLDVRAVRPDLDVRVGVAVTGTAQNPRIKLFSEPEMSDTDKLSWLLLGRAPDGLGRTDTALLQRAALALLSGEGESASGKVIRKLGLDELSLAQGEGDDTRGTVVRLGKQLSRRWYVGYERSLNATTGSWQLVYRIAQRFTLRAQTGEDNALDLIWQWKWE